jgi:glycosyltransferase involved in cell wall biosynthesis
MQLANATLQARGVIIRLMREKRVHFDLVHTNDQLVTNAAWVSAARLCGIPVVAHERQHGDFRRVHRWLATGVAAHIRISQSVDRHCRGRHILSLNDHVIHNGVQLPSLKETRDARVEGRKAYRDLGIDSTAKPVILVPGTLAPWKGADLALRAIALLSRQGYRNLHVVLAGGRSTTKPGWSSALQRMSAELGIAERVRVVGFRPDIAALMAASTVVVHAARRPEPFGRVPLEAMAWGATLVATDVGAIAEVIGRDHPGLVPPESPEALARALGTFLTDPCRGTGVRIRGRTRAERCFSLRSHVNAMEGVFQEAASQYYRTGLAGTAGVPLARDGRNVA